MPSKSKSNMCDCSKKLAEPETVLYLVRLGVAYLFFVWGMDKIVNPGHAAQVFKTFYNANLDLPASYAFGFVQILIAFAFLYGLWKTWTYGAILIMHSVSVLTTLPQLWYPVEPGNHLFVAGAALLLPLIGLFTAREKDTVLTIQKLSKNKLKNMGEKAYTWQYGVYTFGLTAGVLWSLFMYALNDTGYGIRCYLYISVPLFLLGGYFFGKIMYQKQIKPAKKK